MPSKKPSSPLPKTYAQRRARTQKKKTEDRRQRQARHRREADRMRPHFEGITKRLGRRLRSGPVDRAREERWCKTWLSRPTAPAQILDAYLARALKPDKRIVPYVTVYKRTIGASVSAQPVELMRFRELVRTAQRRLSKLMNPNLVLLLWELDRLPWLRPLKAWRSKKGAQAKRLGLLIEHLLAKYGVPPVLLDEIVSLSQRAGDLTSAQRKLLRHNLKMISDLGSGESLRALQRQGHLPQSLTRKMLHTLSKHRGTSSLVRAVREVQVSAYGGGPQLAGAICETILGRRFDDDEPFWATVIHWMCRQDDLDPDQVGPLIDHIEALHREALREGGSWSISGRTPATLMRSMARWHAALQAIASVPKKHFRRSGIAGFSWTRETKVVREVWTIQEILRPEELAREGRDLHHCVASYARAIRSGQCSIWSVKCNGDRVLTIAVSQRAVLEVRGKANRRATSNELRLVGWWAEDNKLS